MNVRELAFCLYVLYQPFFFLTLCSLLLAGDVSHLTPLGGIPWGLSIFVFVRMDKDIVPPSLPPPPFTVLPFGLSFWSLPYRCVPACIEVYNTSTAVESSLASSSFCDSPSILAVRWNTTWGSKWDLSTSGRA